MATATSSTSSIFFNPSTKSQFQPKPTLLISFSTSNFIKKKNKNLNFQRITLVPSRLEFRKQSKVGAANRESSSSEEEEIQSDGGGAAAALIYTDDVFSWNSVLLSFLFPALGGLLFGYDIGATSGASISLQSPKLSGITWFNLSSTQLGLVVRGSFYGAFIGSILVYPVADFLGRRRELIMAALLCTLGGLTTGFAPNLNVLILGRLLYGLGMGLAMHGAPLYVAETCPSQIRGTLIFMKELMIVFGIQLGYHARSVNIDAIGGWRYMFGISAPVALLMGLGMWSLPASPRWLLLRAVHGKASVQECKEKAIAGLSRLRGRPAGEEVSNKLVEETLVSLKEAYADHQQSEGSFLKFFQGLSLKALTVCGGLVLFLKVTANSSVLHYAGSFLQTPVFAAALIAAQVAAVIGLLKFLIGLGRRPLRIGGVNFITASLVFLSAYYKILEGYPLAAVGALLLYGGCYQISFGPISWLMVSEMFPVLTRARGIRGISLEPLKKFVANVALSLAPSSFKEYMISQMSNLLLFVGVALASVLFVVFIVPRTKDRSRNRRF